MYDNQHKSKLQNLSFNGTQPNFEAISHQEKRGQNYFHLFSFNQYIKRHKKTGMHFENFYFWYYWHALLYSTLLYYIVLQFIYCTVLYMYVLKCTVQYNTPTLVVMIRSIQFQWLTDTTSTTLNFINIGLGYNWYNRLE